MSDTKLSTLWNDEDPVYVKDGRLALSWYIADC